MIDKLSDWIRKKSTGRIVISTLVIMFLFTILILPQQARSSERETGSSTSPDTAFYYSPVKLFQIAEIYGAAGRQAYIRARWTFDLIFPLVYISFLTTGISWAYNQIPSQKEPWQRLNLLPVFAGGFDYLENIATTWVMVRYPAHSSLAALLAAIFTPVKWTLISISFLVYLVLLGTLAVNWSRRTFTRIKR
jgi:hypothetical protein